MLHIAADEARRRGRKIGLLFIDLEGQFKLTIEHIRQCFDLYSDIIDPMWVCLPIHLRNAVSVYQPFWVCWEPGEEGAWIRPMPDFPGVISDPEHFDFFKHGMEFEEFVPLFGEWYADGQDTACLVGIRSDESLNRYRTIASTTKETDGGRQYTTRVSDNVWNVYPVYDWNTSDVWAYQGRNPDKPYNRLYDYMYKAGLTIHQMRICQPYGDDQRRGLWLYHLVEPETWARAVARVNGANSGALYMQEWGNVTGYRKISKPPGLTWQQFADLLLGSMPPLTQEQMQNKVLLFQKWWMERGYPDGIPDEAPYELEAARKVPSWRRVCKSLLRNDYWCKGLGFTQHKSRAYSKYLDLMRRRKETWSVDTELMFPTEAVEPKEVAASQ
jgi:predicted phosphoadenosine phosphosulfate sulfurtransferase